MCVKRVQIRVRVRVRVRVKVRVSWMRVCANRVKIRVRVRVRLRVCANRVQIYDNKQPLIKAEYVIYVRYYITSGRLT